MDITPAHWSAVAAVCSALTALTVARIQFANRRDGARPELVLDGWSRHSPAEGAEGPDIIAFRTIRNVGRGPAIPVIVNCSREEGGFPLASMSTIQLPILAPGESVEVDARILIWWKNVKPDESGGRWLPLCIDIFSFDTIGLRHHTTYRPLVVPIRQPMTSEVAPGVGLMSRDTRTTRAWQLRLVARLLPVRRVFRFLWPSVARRVRS